MRAHTTPRARLRRPYHVFCGVLLAVCTGGMAISMIFNVGALAGVDWSGQSKVFWFCQGMLVTAYLPICVEIIRTRSYQQILQPQRWQKRALWGIAAYYTASFYFFAFRAASELEGAFTWEMISAGMVLAFSIAATHYATRYSGSKGNEKERAATLPSA